MLCLPAPGVWAWLEVNGKDVLSTSSERPLRHIRPQGASVRKEEGEDKEEEERWEEVAQKAEGEIENHMFVETLL